ncbi:hypothetical protein Pmar_PMAR027776 [Perkinsus marinus ATCC 50983]|uniref:Uncharacterized protein n=1 Tax=Perkinsus marinus (strain ATCC 50983 / TXsc) TaxID=423536 RepID=C5LS70_PERM5|nr:hypothetical protein Pmar_PMAR027776 [Perkinsus marinus ATCC 50983]EER00432.1 hypothetical protein Pmar_PMAR027776 [Perkinsus marinus ATCC 50983]|eukprot:XP_002767714.1 hypothetical protein Pmar_PMAR027776 [Perkinsus marinus ATCC 50983]
MHAHAGRLEETSAESGKKSCGSLWAQLYDYLPALPCLDGDVREIALAALTRGVLVAKFHSKNGRRVSRVLRIIKTPQWASIPHHFVYQEETCPGGDDVQ